MMESNRLPIKCSCCGKKVMAEQVGDTIVIKARRGKIQHTAIINLTSGPTKSDTSIG